MERVRSLDGNRTSVSAGAPERLRQWRASPSLRLWAVNAE
jgi:hypothetical protein